MAHFTQDQKKAIQPKIKKLLKEYGLKGSLSIRHYSKVVLTIQSGKIDFNVGERGYTSINHFHIKNNYKGIQQEFLLKAKEILNEGNYNNSDPMTDYYDVGHYIEIAIGKYNKPYILMENKENKKPENKILFFSKKNNENNKKPNDFYIKINWTQLTSFYISFSEEKGLEFIKYEGDSETEKKELYILNALQAFLIIKPFLKNNDFQGLFNIDPDKIYKNHRHYEICRRAHYNTSFSPEKRALTACKSFDAEINHFRKCGAGKKQIEKLESLFIDWQYKKSRCLSSMITGPANFPVRRNEKANESERKAGNAYYDYYNGIIKKIKHAKFKQENPELVPIRNNDQNAKEKLESKLKKYKDAHEKMKLANKLVRSKDIDGLKDLLGEKGLELLEPDSMGNIGFASYALSNNLAEIKRLEARIKKLESIESIGTKEIIINDNTKIVQCSDTKRIYIEFDGIPQENIRKHLKSNGFRWTPSKKHWGRVLTSNAVYVTQKRIIPFFKENQQQL